jgi:iron only hydrogenase large subunit-like protein
MSVCPTEAIRVRDGKARILEERCIDCGECYRKCPVSAIKVEENELGMIFDYKYRVALLPTIFTGQFPDEIKPLQIYNALHQLGFTHVHEVEKSAGIVSALQNKEIQDQKVPKPCISTFCPAVIRLIQVNFPLLVDNLSHVKPPVDLAALFIRKKLETMGLKKEDTGLFYITPCAAKIAAIKSPVGENQSSINGVINMNSLFHLVQSKVKHAVNHGQTRQSISGNETIWPLTGGERVNIKGSSLAIDGIKNVIAFLEKIENEEISGVDFLETRACDQSCAGGILVPENKFLAAERLNRRAAKNAITIGVSDEVKAHEDYLIENSRLQQLKPRSALKLDNDTSRAMEKMKRMRKIMCFLPGFDCGGCGSPTCQALSEDIVQGNANISYCVFMQKVMQKNHKLSTEHALSIIEKIWGKQRLDKNCNKIGADNEN